MKKALVLLLVTVIVFLLAGCLPSAQYTQAPSLQTPVPTAIATPPPFVLEEAQQLLTEVWQQSTLDFSLVPQEAWSGHKSPIEAQTVEDTVWLPLLAAQLQQQFETGARTALDTVALHYHLKNDVIVQAEAPSWQLTYTVLVGTGNAEAARSMLLSLFTPQIQLQQTSETLHGTLSISSPDYRTALKSFAPEQSQYLSSAFLYSYLYTVYDSECQMQEYALPAATGNLANGIVWPLKSYRRLRKTWYADRDGGIRRHTGTDIWAKADTEIYSCTDGDVSFVGYSDGMGNYVIITDDYGYEFHYYHMIRRTDFLQPGDRVTAGELIGHVGNTGNSDLDHLHLTIVAPDGLFINPYPYLYEVRP